MVESSSANIAPNTDLWVRAGSNSCKKPEATSIVKLHFVAPTNTWSGHLKRSWTLKIEQKENDEDEDDEEEEGTGIPRGLGIINLQSISAYRQADQTN